MATSRLPGWAIVSSERRAFLVTCCLLEVAAAVLALGAFGPLPQVLQPYRKVPIQWVSAVQAVPPLAVQEVVFVVSVVLPGYPVVLIALFTRSINSKAIPTRSLLIYLRYRILPDLTTLRRWFLVQVAAGLSATTVPCHQYCARQSSRC